MPNNKQTSVQNIFLDSPWLLCFLFELLVFKTINVYSCRFSMHHSGVSGWLDKTFGIMLHRRHSISHAVDQCYGTRFCICLSLNSISRNIIIGISFQSFCNTYGATLAEIESAAEDRFLQDQAKSLGGRRYVLNRWEISV